uniref:RBR-type E3 ubiquitin transferase n=1 Tax=Kwoniella pini CBS 10737 TaxID=1296096 RepID=A0A1B9I0N3_9TREE|nr:ariadne-1 [Kwoniella pini CBS 10737]OCF49074.1 ariadne-1 [Kwoniella pini CBS 10737]
MSSDGENDEFLYEDAYDDAFDQDDEVDDLDSMSEPDVYDALSPAIEEAPQRKPYDVSWKVKTLQEIIDMQTKEISKIQSVLEVPPSSAAILLRHYVWNSEKLQEQFWNDPASALEEAGLSPPSSPTTRTSTLPPSPTRRTTRSLKAGPSTSLPKRARSINTGSFECPICCMEFDELSVPSQTYSMGCEHRFCKDCWKEYLVVKIKGEGESAKIQCMESGCGRVVREEVIDDLADSLDIDRYHNLLNAAFVADSSTLRWCPHPNCEYIIQCTQAPPRMLNQLVPTVECKCGHDLCFGCGYAASHRPVLCKIVRLWEKKCADDSETANWLQANTKECTKCQSTIEKNGGCNHMTCKKCKWEFCWVCMGPWSEHGTAWYQCNRFDEKSGIDARDTQAKSRASLERYLHYFSRWANHEHSAKLDGELYQKTEKKMEQMQNSGNLSWIEVQFAKQAVDVAIKARVTLKWSYCMAFYLKRNNMTELFEDNQRDLERAVETLGYSLEQSISDTESIAKLRQDITNQAAYVQKRHDILMDDTLKGYLERRWEFSVDI